MGDSNGDSKSVVAFLGPVASYTHQAAQTAFPPTTHTLAPQPSIEDVFLAVQSSTATRGVVPFENSSNGSVVFTLDLFADQAGKYQDIFVCGEVYVRVVHCLLGRRRGVGDEVKSGDVGENESGSGAATPTMTDPNPNSARAGPVPDLKHVKHIYSHPQAWGQCKKFLSTHLKGVERHDVSSTSRAAQIAAEDESGSSAAVSSGIAAQVWGLDVLVGGVEDRRDNCTRFFVLQRQDTSSSPSTTDSTSVPALGDGREEGGDFKTLISFTVDHENPGALAQSLSVFEKYDINLTSINTRPSGEENWNYIFFVEIQGRRGDGKVDGALEELGRVCRGWRWLGSWESGGG